MSYLKNKKDANHQAVREHLENHGADVLELLKPLDLLAYYRGFVGWIEVKIPGSDACYTRKQLRFIADTRFPVAIVKNGPQALEYLRTGHGITGKQKDAIAGLLVRSAKDKFTPAEVEAVLGMEIQEI